jgi:predicted metal-dependent HD superfamily phosphohydrolase
MSINLHDRWHALCERVGAFKTADESGLTFDMLRTLYTHPVRAYHNLDHIAHVLSVFDSVRMLADERDIVEFALWVHDCVFFPERADNEDRSADAAGMMAGLLGCQPDFAARVRECILATHHSEAPPKGDASLVADIDLAILAAPEAEYDAYAAAIRREFGFATDEQFRDGRMAFLQRMIDKDQIFATPHFRREMERAARENLQRELDELERAAGPRPA